MLKCVISEIDVFIIQKLSIFKTEVSNGNEYSITNEIKNRLFLYPFVSLLYILFLRGHSPDIFIKLQSHLSDWIETNLIHSEYDIFKKLTEYNQIFI